MKYYFTTLLQLIPKCIYYLFNIYDNLFCGPLHGASYGTLDCCELEEGFEICGAKICFQNRNQNKHSKHVWFVTKLKTSRKSSEWVVSFSSISFIIIQNWICRKHKTSDIYKRNKFHECRILAIKSHKFRPFFA